MQSGPPPDRMPEIAAEANSSGMKRHATNAQINFAQNASDVEHTHTHTKMTGF